MFQIGKQRRYLQTTTDHAINGIVAATADADNLNFGVIYVSVGASHRTETTT